MIRKFVNRDEEIGWLEEKLGSNDRELLVIYGRRRVGKTELINHVTQKKVSDSQSIYFLADQRGTSSNARRLAKDASEHFDDIPPDVDSFDDCFKYIRERSHDTELIVVIDEFSYLVEKDDSVPSVFQLIWDEILKDTQISLVLLGSSISMMEEGVLSYESPLYGRRTGQWRLRPLEFGDSTDFFSDSEYPFDDKIRAYGVLGGIPAYLEKFDPQRGLFENIRDEILSKGTFLYEEPEFLLRQELREPSSYMDILEAMSFGATTVTEIANSTHREAKDMSRYLKKLQSLDLVEKSVPVTASQKKKKRGIYEIKDNFFSFWFRFVYPNLDDLERGSVEGVLDTVREGIDVYTSRVFEDICREAVANSSIFDGSSVGSWWYGENEIDVVGLDESEASLLLGECKWTERQVDADLLRRLEKKSSEVRWRGEDRDETFALFSRSGFSRDLRDTAKERDDVRLYDLDTLREII
ncbi:MAG: ATP-binding protein [Halobacteria archaeon]|nr:ATP-binding protein [Halobacteria archaeon]